MNVGIVIQGKTTYYQLIEQRFSGVDLPIVFSTYDSDAIDGSIPVLQSVDPGIVYSNFFDKYSYYQSRGVMDGIEYLKKLDCDLFLKFRSDIIPDSYKDVCTLVSCLKDRFDRNKKIISYSLSINQCCQVQDWIIFGTENHHKTYWTNCDDNAQYFTAEHRFFDNYSKNNNLGLTLEDMRDVEKIRLHYDFCIDDIIQNNIRLKIFYGRDSETYIDKYNYENSCYGN